MSAAPPESFWAGVPLGRGVTVLARDAQGLVALNKPAGVLSHPNRAGEEARALLQAPYVFEGEFFEWGTGAEAGGSVAAPAGRAGQRLWLLNRLDSATSGVILAAAREDLAREIRAQFKRKTVRKVYHALVFGAPRQPMELWRDLLAVEKRHGQIRTATAAGNVPAESRMSVVRPGRGTPRVTLVRLEPRTGRSHQLRVQCAKRHLPIVGDQTYGDFRANREFARLAGTKRMFLHSMETSFDYEFAGQSHHFAARAPLPEEFEKFL